MKSCIPEAPSFSPHRWIGDPKSGASLGIRTAICLRSARRSRLVGLETGKAIAQGGASLGRDPILLERRNVWRGPWFSESRPGLLEPTRLWKSWRGFAGTTSPTPPLPSTKPFMENTEPGDHKRNNRFQVLIDSDAFVGWMMALDAHHKQARQIFRRLKERQSRLVTTSFVVAETVTVLSHRSGKPWPEPFLMKQSRMAISRLFSLPGSCISRL
jgi:hypothetical protein